MWSNQQLAIGDIRPQEDEVTKVVVPQVAATPISADVPDATLYQASDATPERAVPHLRTAVPHLHS